MKNKKLLLGLLLGIGFAAVSTTLYLNGNVNISTNNDDFDVIFTKAVLDGTDISSTAIEDGGKSITFSTKDLINVGDVSKLDFEVTNNSTMYDTEVSINCTAGSGEDEYYQINEEVVTLIAGKRTGTGKVEVSLLKAPIIDIQETFTCTLSVTAKERDTIAKQLYIPKFFAVGSGNDIPTASSTQDYKTLTYPEYSYSGGIPARLFVGLDDEGQKSVCMLKNGNLECFKSGESNALEEQDHLREVFGKENCRDNILHDSGYLYVNCDGADDFHGNVRSDGYIYFYDGFARFSCSTDSHNVSCG